MARHKRPAILRHHSSVVDPLLTGTPGSSSHFPHTGLVSQESSSDSEPRSQQEPLRTPDMLEGQSRSAAMTLPPPPLDLEEVRGTKDLGSRQDFADPSPRGHPPISLRSILHPHRPLLNRQIFSQRTLARNLAQRLTFIICVRKTCLVVRRIGTEPSLSLLNRDHISFRHSWLVILPLQPSNTPIARRLINGRVRYSLR